MSLRVREVLEAAGHRERLQDRDLPVHRLRPGLLTSPITKTIAGIVSTTMTVTTGLVMYS